MKKQLKNKVLKTIPRSNKLVQALQLPKVINLNPRSIYNKVNEFCVYVEEEEVDIIFMSESHERWYCTNRGEDQTLENIINLEDHIVISNPSQRKGKGGRPALVINNVKYTVQNLTQSEIVIPWGVEIVLAVITPLNVTQESKIQKIVLGSLYCKPGSKKKTALLNHISEVYQILNGKYNKGLHWILAGDFNDLKIQSILDITPSLKQVVTQPTRFNPPAILDKIITSLHNYYQVPEVKPPLDNDPDKNGKPSDHNIVEMRPVNVVNNKPARSTTEFTYRPITERGMQQMQEWFESRELNVSSHGENPHERAEEIMKVLKEKTNEFFPTKTRKIRSDNQPFFNEKLATQKRKKQREYNKNRQLLKWAEMNKEYNKNLDHAKKQYYKKEISKLKKSNPRKWFYWLKRIVSKDQSKEKEICVDEINHLSNKEQAEILADSFSKISQEYEKLKKTDIDIPPFLPADIPKISVKTVEKYLLAVKTCKSTTRDDIPAVIFKKFAKELSDPISILINSCILKGVCPNILKREIVTPIPKVYPPLKMDDLRNISGLPTLNKIAEKCIAELMLKDMKAKLDVSQYSNQKGIGIQHYLVNMIDRILLALEDSANGDAKAVDATLVDWKQAFPRQCPKLGLEAFVKMGIRPSLIPVLLNYFQNRVMQVKWKGEYSTVRELNGGGSQGALLGNLEYLAQSNDNAEMVNPEDIFKFVDDLTLLEVINLLLNQVSSYDIQAHVPSDIPTHNGYIERAHLKSQENLSLINSWTKKKKMILNMKKTKNMIFNYTRNHQFTIRLKEENKVVEVVDKMKLLGTILTNDLKWDANTSYLVKKAYKRMQLLHNVAKFTKETTDLKSIYITYIRPVLEQSSIVWHSSLTKENCDNLERVQRSAIRLIMGRKNFNYKESLLKLNLTSLEERRTSLCLNFAKRATMNNRTKKMFPLRKEQRTNTRRFTEKFIVKKARTKIYQQSTIPFLQNLLNENYKQKHL